MEIALKEALGMIVLGNLDEYYELFQKIAVDHFIDRLYRQYVKQEDVQNTLDALDNCLSKVSEKNKKKILKLKNSLNRGNEAAKLCIEDYGKYISVRIVLFDEPYCTLSDNIPLKDYDNIEGEPFWMRPEYILEHYSQTRGNYEYKD